MSRFTIGNDLKVKIQTRLRIDSLKTDSYESSILYQTDILNNQSGFDEINQKVEEFKLETKKLYTWSTNTTTSFNNISNKLKNLAYSSVLNNMLQESRGVKDKIYSASNTVFNKKLANYQNNYKETTNIEKLVEDKLTKYDNLDKKRKSLSQSNPSMDLQMSDRSNLDNEIRKCKLEMDNLLIECNSMIEKFDNLNKNNEELVNDYLKRI